LTATADQISSTTPKGQAHVEFSRIVDADADAVAGLFDRAAEQLAHRDFGVFFGAEGRVGVDRGDLRQVGVGIDPGLPRLLAFLRARVRHRFHVLDDVDRGRRPGERFERVFVTAAAAHEDREGDDGGEDRDGAHVQHPTTTRLRNG